MEITTAVGLAMSLMEKIKAALAARQETIEVEDLGIRAADVDARIQAARGTGGDSG